MVLVCVSGQTEYRFHARRDKDRRDSETKDTCSGRERVEKKES